ncbi:MAG: hypothetical protein HQ581_21725 [Planctomycetes bacterium]|nr:hypothetical protein [Planctomycetota bacterium]
MTRRCRKPNTTALKLRAVLISIALLGSVASQGAEPNVLALENEHIRATFHRVYDSWRLTGLARADGSDALEVTSDEFEILRHRDSRFTIKDYRTVEAPQRQNRGGTQSLTVVYAPKLWSSNAPESVTVTYSLGSDPWLHKTVLLTLDADDTVERLQVQRFSCDQKASRGGEGQPVFVGDWFFGVDYPGFYSRHSDGFVEPDFRYKWHYTVDFEGGNRELAPRDGLVTLFHFPGYAKQQPDGTWAVRSKRAVMGISRNTGDSAELALKDYIDQTRLPTRSYLHLNNWYSRKAKSLDTAVFADDVARTIQQQMRAHGANLDGMVPDHGWENTKTFDRIFQPKDGLDLGALHDALAAHDVGLGLWMTFDGTNAGFGRGLQVGYKPAYSGGFDRSQQAWMSGNKVYFDLLDPKYQEDIRRALRQMIEVGKIDYIKHDFNHNFTSNYLSQRHAREACLDVTLELLAYERELNPRIFQNYTNGSWFSPWWFQHVHTIWMMSGDSGSGGSWPQLSLRAGATAYRDSWLYQSFNNPTRCVRPLISIADLMTHGILLTHKKPYTDFQDTLRDWSDYVVMYYARGTTLKELYIDNELLDDDHWKVLAKASAWAQANQHGLSNTVLIGGDCARGEVYGYVSWVGDRAILTVRNPDRRAQTLEIPFDASVYFRGEPGLPYHARAVYPFVEEMPWRFTSGTPFSVDVPGDSTLILEIEPGAPTAEKAAMALPLPPAEAKLEEAAFQIRLSVPDEQMLRYDLLVQAWGAALSRISLDGKDIEPRVQDGGSWTLSAYDLRKYRGRTVTIRGHLVASGNPALGRGGTVPVEIWLVADRKVHVPPPPTGKRLPLPLSHQYRRLTQRLISKSAITVVRRGRGAD